MVRLCRLPHEQRSVGKSSRELLRAHLPSRPRGRFREGNIGSWFTQFCRTVGKGERLPAARLCVNESLWRRLVACAADEKPPHRCPQDPGAFHFFNARCVRIANMRFMRCSLSPSTASAFSRAGRNAGW